MDQPSKSNVFDLRSSDPLTGQLQDELYAVVTQSKFDRLQMCAIVGVLEFLKWNLINRSE
ncbi:hypothetical protein C9I56_11240 [Paraburkholderia caribensis]|uniref:hypothetical protein n=1 Tax=Paraburkholderia caribensis TaxID=75105 RepID=UPI000D17247D|nr:hypothetical protein [Paraburkholderia caribensis]PTB28857.1 hypothetical protein C9I56_11240 [Paraburkholderia caribensis]